MEKILHDIVFKIDKMSIDNIYDNEEIIRINEYKKIINQSSSTYDTLLTLREHISKNLHKESKKVLRKHNGYKRINKPLISLSTLNAMSLACRIEKEIIKQSIYLDLRISLNDMMKNDLQEE